MTTHASPHHDTHGMLHSGRGALRQNILTEAATDKLYSVTAEDADFGLIAPNNFTPVFLRPLLVC